MKKELAVEEIYNDFKRKTILTENEEEILIRYIKKESIIKIADETKQGTTTVSRTIAVLKEKYNNYKKMELAKMIILLGNK